MSSRRRKGKPKTNLKTRTISNAKPTTPASRTPSASPSGGTNVPARYVSEIRNIMSLLMRNKGSEPFKTVPNLPQYKSMFPTALCLQMMNQKALREPCGYKSFKEFDSDFKTCQRQEIRYDNKVSSGISAQRKHKIEILRGYYDTLAQPYLTHGPNLSPSNQRKRIKTPSTVSPLPQARKLIVPQSSASTASSNAPSSPRATLTMKKKEQASRPPPSTKKATRREAVIDLCEDIASTPPPSATIPPPPSTVKTNNSSTMRRKKSQTTGRKRLHFDSPTGGDETKADEAANGSGAPKKKRRTTRNESASDDDVVVVSSTTMTTTRSKKLTSPRASSLDPLSTPVSRTGFSFERTTSSSSVVSKPKDDTPRYGDKGGHSHLFGTGGRPPKMEDVKMTDDDSKDDGTELMKQMEVETPRGRSGRSGGVVLGNKTTISTRTTRTTSSTSLDSRGRNLTPRFTSSTSVSSYSSLQRRPTTWMGRLLRDSDGDVNMFTNTPTRTHEDVLHLLQWKRFELTVEIWQEEKHEWKSKVVVRDGFEMQAVVRKFFDVHPNLKMRVTNVRFLHNVSYDDEDDAN